jgi:hypothetical protein
MGPPRKRITAMIDVAITGVAFSRAFYMGKNGRRMRDES